VEKNNLTAQIRDIDFISGLLLALVSGPDLVSPSEWLPPVYTDEVQPPATNPMRHVGRNDPCPCGSGRKYKKCCLN